MVDMHIFGGGICGLSRNYLLCGNFRYTEKLQGKFLLTQFPITRSFKKKSTQLLYVTLRQTDPCFCCNVGISVTLGNVNISFKSIVVFLHCNSMAECTWSIYKAVNLTFTKHSLMENQSLSFSCRECLLNKHAVYERAFLFVLDKEGLNPLSGFLDTQDTDSPIGALTLPSAV